MYVVRQGAHVTYINIYVVTEIKTDVFTYTPTLYGVIYYSENDVYHIAIISVTRLTKETWYYAIKECI